MESPPTDVSNGIERTNEESIVQEATQLAIRDLLRSQNVDGIENDDLAFLLQRAVLDHPQPMDAHAWRALYENNIPAERRMRLSAEQIWKLGELHEQGRESALLFEDGLVFAQNWEAQENERASKHLNASHVSSFAQDGTYERDISSSGGGSTLEGKATLSVSRRTGIQHSSAITTGHDGALALSGTGLDQEAQRDEINLVASNPEEELVIEQQRVAEIMSEVFASMGESVDEIRRCAEELVGKLFPDSVEDTVSLRVATPQSQSHRASYHHESYRDSNGAPQHKIARTDNSPVRDDGEAPGYAWPEDFEPASTPTSQSSDFSEVATSSSSTVVNTPPPTGLATGSSQHARGTGVSDDIADKAFPASSDALYSVLSKTGPSYVAAVDAGTPGPQAKAGAVDCSPSTTPVATPANDDITAVQHSHEHEPSPPTAAPASTDTRAPSVGSSSLQNSPPGLVGPPRYNRAGVLWKPDRNMPSKVPSPPGALVSPDPSFLRVYTDDERLNFHDLPAPVNRQLIFDVDEIKRLNSARAKEIIEEQIQEWQDRYDIGKEKYPKKWPGKTARSTIQGAIESLVKIIERFEECGGCIPIPGQQWVGFSVGDVKKPFATYDRKKKTWSDSVAGSRGQKRSRE